MFNKTCSLESGKVPWLGGRAWRTPDGVDFADLKCFLPVLTRLCWVAVVLLVSKASIVRFQSA